MIDNFDLLRKFVPETKDEGLVLHLQIFKRRKDNPDLSHNCVLLGSYFINSQSKYDKLRPTITELCKAENARAMLSLSPRSEEDLTHTLALTAAQRVYNKDYHSPWCIFDSVFDNIPATKKYWVVDIDNLTLESIIYKSLINDSYLTPSDITRVPTKNGCHYIIEPVDIRPLRELIPELDVHKNNPTVLFIP